MDARYADGRAAVTHPTQVTLDADALHFVIANMSFTWLYADLSRADDNNGLIILKRHPEHGERLILPAAYGAELAAAAPLLCAPRAHGVESRVLIGGLFAAALSLAAAFLIGVPLAAEPIARVMPPRYQEQIGEIARAQMEGMTDYCTNAGEGQIALDRMVGRFLDASHDRESERFKSEVRVLLVHAPIPNAFALPDNSIIVTDRLIEAASSPDEIAGVVAHELGHITHRHVMANVIRNIGAGVFFDIVFGGAGLGQAAAIASVNIAALGYDRRDEAEADSTALDYLDAASVDPAALGRFFDRIARIGGEEGRTRLPTLLSTHPASAERAALARARAHPGRPPALSAAEWRAVRMACQDGQSAAETNPVEKPAPTLPTKPAPKP